ncbi:MAG: hypothetical protein H7840_08415 [Alphaproteobacteria bacterium]
MAVGWIVFHSGLLMALTLASPASAANYGQHFGVCHVVTAAGPAPVPMIADRSIRDVSLATIRRGVPVIDFNPDVAERMTPATRLFFHAHECAHHALGHTLGAGRPDRVEQEADCWAIRGLVGLGLVGPRDVALVQVDLLRFAPPDATHVPGAVRAVNLLRCLDPGDGDQ